MNPDLTKFLFGEHSTRAKRGYYTLVRGVFGKDVLALNILLAGALQRVGTYAYVLPTYESCRGIVWDAVMSSNGKRMLSFIPEELIESKNEQLMRVKLINGSVLKFLGSDNYNNSIVDRTFAGMVFSEFALQNENGWKYSIPILAESDGWALFVTTVRGKNFLFDLYEETVNNPKWFVLKHTIDDTKHINAENWAQIEKEYSPDYIAQEFYCDWNLGVEGTIYGKYIDKMRLNSQIGSFPHQSKYRVNTAFDVGNDTTSIIWWQVVSGGSIHIIDYHEDKNKNLEHYVGIVEERRKKYEYIYNKHFFPHDMDNKNFDGPRYTRTFKVQQMGLEGVNVVKKVKLDDGIEWTRSNLKNMFIDEKKCGQLIKCMENYRYELNEERRVYSTKPVHNWASHGASAMMYLALSIPHAGLETTPEELRSRYENAMNRRNGGNMVSVESVFKGR